MDAFITAYLPSDAVGYVTQWFQLFPVGIALGLAAWLITFCWSSVVNFFKM